MTYAEIKNAINRGNNGQFRQVSWGKELKTKKAYATMRITKETYGTVRFGLRYDNMGNVQAKRTEGELPSTNQGLPWGEWIDNHFIGHNGKTYVRLYLTNNNPLHTKYYLNGIETTAEIIKPMCLASEFSTSTSRPDCLTITTENIKSIK